MLSVVPADPAFRKLLRGRAVGNFAVAQASGDDVDKMLVTCLAQLAKAPQGVTIGFVYLSSSLADHFDRLLLKLNHAMPRVSWIGATVDSVMAECAEHRQDGALAIMVGEVSVDQFRILAGVRRSLSGRLSTHHGWRQRNGISGALIHADSNSPMTPDLISELSAYVGDVPLVGGMLGRNKPSLQIAVSVVSGGLSGVLFGKGVSLVTGKALGCSPIGLPHTITRMAGGNIYELDRRPALDVLFEEAGELLSRDLTRLSGYICPALATQSGSGVYTPAEFLSLDPVKRSFRVDETIALSGELRFYRRDGDAAWRHFEAMLTEAVERTRGRRIKAGFFIGGRDPLSQSGTELASIRAALGQFPLIGYRADRDIFGGQCFSHTSVLSLIVG